MELKSRETFFLDRTMTFSSLLLLGGFRTNVFVSKRCRYYGITDFWKSIAAYVFPSNDLFFPPRQRITRVFSRATHQLETLKLLKARESLLEHKNHTMPFETPTFDDGRESSSLPGTGSMRRGLLEGKTKEFYD